MNMKKSLALSIGWVLLSLAFAIVLGTTYGIGTSVEFLSVYTVEKLLSLDNLLVFFIVFRHLSASPYNQSRYLTIGIWSACIMRAVMIFGGMAVINRWPVINYFLGLFLMWSAYKIGFLDDGDEIPKTDTIDKIRGWFTGRSSAFVIVAVIEIMDVLFAFDSIPAGFSLTKNPLVMYSANVFAICGLRSMYFVLANMLEQSKILEKGICVILALVGWNMLQMPYLHLDNLSLFASILTILGFTYATIRYRR